MTNYNRSRENSLEFLFFEITPQQVLKFLLRSIGFLVAINLIVQFGFYYIPDYPLKNILSGLFYLDYETNIPTMYSVLTLLSCSVILGLIARVKQVNFDPFVNYWSSLAVVFLFLSIDEFTTLHEKLIEPLRIALNADGFFYFAWVIPGIAFIFAFLLVFTKFLYHLPSQTRRLFLLAGGLYIGGVLGVEMLAAYYSSSIGGEDNIIYAIIVTMEEGLEMLGIAVFIYSLLHYISHYMKIKCLQLDLLRHKPKCRSI